MKQIKLTNKEPLTEKQKSQIDNTMLRQDVASLKKQLKLHVVSQRSELFEAYEKYRDYDHYMAYKKVIDQEIKGFIAKNCG